MKKNIHKFQVGSSISERPFPSFKQVHSQKREKINLKEKLLPICILAFLGIWISLCLSHGDFLLDKALLGSSIVVCLLFFKAADQNGDLNNNNNNNN